MKFAVGTTNKAKIEAVSAALKKCNFRNTNENCQSNTSKNNNNNNNNNDHDKDKDVIIGISGVDSKVSPQPFSLNETRRGAFNRAKGAIEECAKSEENKDVTFGIGIEGGIEVVIEGEDDYQLSLNNTERNTEKKNNNNKVSLFVVGWICVIHSETGVVGWGSSARMEIPPLFASKLKIKEDFSGTESELAKVIDEVSGQQQDLRSSLGVEGLLTNGGLDRGGVYEQAIVAAFSRFVSPKGLW